MNAQNDFDNERTRKPYVRTVPRKTKAQVEASDEIGYGLKYTDAQRKRFWEHGLNPITGMPPSTEHYYHKPEHIATFKTIGARVNSILIK